MLFGNTDDLNKLVIGVIVGLFACGMAICGCCGALGYFLYKQCTKSEDNYGNAFDVIIHTPAIITEEMTMTMPTDTLTVVSVGETEDVAFS
jgi:hypothetical protein